MGLKKLSFVKDYRCFKAGESFDFRPGVNLLVGDQGSGKSTLLQILHKPEKYHKDGFIKLEADPSKTLYLDTEKHNLRTKSHFSNELVMQQVLSHFVSHGQFINQANQVMRETENTIFFVDEPDCALSIRSAKKLVDTMNIAVQNGCQIVASVHNSIIIQAYDEVLSLEHKKWMKSQDFINAHLTF